MYRREPTTELHKYAFQCPEFDTRSILRDVADSYRAILADAKASVEIYEDDPERQELNAKSGIYYLHSMLITRMGILVRSSKFDTYRTPVSRSLMARHSESGMLAEGRTAKIIKSIECCADVAKAIAIKSREDQLEIIKIANIRLEDWKYSTSQMSGYLKSKAVHSKPTRRKSM